MYLKKAKNAIGRHGIRKSAQLVFQRGWRMSGIDQWRCRNAPLYVGPTASDLDSIENQLNSSGIPVDNYSASFAEFAKFKRASLFPEDYPNHIAVRDEKLLEHFIASNLLEMSEFSRDDVYVDIAACSSPWAAAVREHFRINAYAIDLTVPRRFSSLDFYRQEDATKTSFSDASVRGMSLQCAFEMFNGDDDINFIKECGRILSPGGKVVILPLYMHTHYCAYATPEYWGKGYSDSQATEYLRNDCWGVPSSRKYDPTTLENRILITIRQIGLTYRLLALRNKAELGSGIYCHFILEIQKPG